jgi:hypothetical protein
MNDIGRKVTTTVGVDVTKLKTGLQIKDATDLQTGTPATLNQRTKFQLSPYGITVLKLRLE